MKIYLPWINPIETECLPEDFEEQVRKSFAKFTEETNEEYTYQDKLLYLDNLRKTYVKRDISVKNLIAEKVVYSLEYGEMPDTSEILSLEFMEECFDGGFRPFYYAYYTNDRYTNDRTMQVIADIIKIVMNYEKE